MLDDDKTIPSCPAIPNTIPDKPFNAQLFTKDNQYLIPFYLDMCLSDKYPRGGWSRLFQAKNTIKMLKGG